MNYKAKLDTIFSLLGEMALARHDAAFNTRTEFKVELAPHPELTASYSDVKSEAEAVNRWLEDLKETGRSWQDIGYRDEREMLANLGVTRQSQRFNNADQKAVKNETAIKQIHADLANSSFEWNIIFDDNQPNGRELKERGYVLDGHITFVKSSSSGDVLTPFMVRHVIAHGIFSQLPERQFDISDLIYAFATRVSGRPGRSLAVVSQFLHFRSAIAFQRQLDKSTPERQRVLLKPATDLDELIYDIMAIFIKNERIKFEPNDYCRIQITPEVKELIAATKKGLEGLLMQSLRDCVGRVLND